MSSEEADQALTTGIKNDILALSTVPLLKITVEAMSVYGEHPGDLITDLGAVLAIADHIQQTHGRVHIMSLALLTRVIGRDSEDMPVRGRKLRTILRAMTALQYITDIDPITRMVKVNVSKFEPQFVSIRGETVTDKVLAWNEPDRMETQLDNVNRANCTKLCQQLAEFRASLTE